MFGSSETSPKGLCLAVLQSRKAVVILQIRHALRQLCLSVPRGVGSRALCPRASLSLCHLGFEGVGARTHVELSVMQITLLAGRAISPVVTLVGRGSRAKTRGRRLFFVPGTSR
ncbi:hypothetical protein [Streptacidiphilus neutrinimicus]|uniref:hypothetical protein n=1 Tax=Streptacidiphilus neutrinimicus TaxID=105420 RepID=UPI001269FBA1|nr:hypothetical protein [Streptacidiphilus neutrinimicus]